MPRIKDISRSHLPPLQPSSSTLRGGSRQLEALVLRRELFSLIPMLMDAPINPSPSVHNRIPSPRHVGRGVKAPVGGLLGANLSSAAEQRPDGLWAASVAGIVLLVHVVNQRKHGPRVAVHHKRPVELVRPPRRLLDRDRLVGRAQLRRRLEVAQILALVQRNKIRW